MSRSRLAIGFLALMFFDTLAQISFKYAANFAFPPELEWHWIAKIFSHIWIYGALIGYLGAFFIWISLLKYAPVGPSFAASHLEIVTVSLISIWLFHEPLTASKIIGAIFILLGVACLAKEHKG